MSTDLHHLRVRRFQRGMTAILPTRPVYGCTGTCSCGWEGRSNYAPSRGGIADLRHEHRVATGARTEVVR